MRTCFQRQFSSISCIFNSSKHVPVAKKWQKRRKRVLTNCNHAKSDGNVVSTKTFSSLQKIQFLVKFQLFLVLVNLLSILTHGNYNYITYSSFQKRNKQIFCYGNVFWQILFPPKAMWTCFGDGNVFYKLKLMKMRRERIYKNAFFGPLKACYGHKGLCTRWGRSQGFRKYP